MILNLILILFGLIVFPILFWKFISRKRHLKEAPVVSGWIPWLGVGLEFGRDPVAFLKRAHLETNSQVISCRMAGQKMHFLLNQEDLAVMTKNHKILEFDTFTNEIIVNSFGLSPQSIPLMPITAPDIHKVLTTHLRGEALDVLTYRFARNFQTNLTMTLSQIDVTHSIDIYQFIVTLVFNSGGDAFFGENWSNQSGILQYFQHFDAMFPHMCRGVPLWMLGCTDERARLCLAMCSNGRQDVAEIVKLREEIFRRHQVPEADIRALQFAFLWASQANTVAAAGWTAIHMYSDPVILQAARQEIDNVIGPIQPSEVRPDQLQRLTLLESCIYESMRLYGSIMMVRKANENIQLPFHRAPDVIDEFWIQKGDYVVLFTPYFNLDASQYLHPLEWVGDRHAKPFSPFGAGKSMCPGRYFAINEVKMILVMLLTNLHISLDRPKLPDPQPRIGFGICPPNGQVMGKISIH